MNIRKLSVAALAGSLLWSAIATAMVSTVQMVTGLPGNYSGTLLLPWPSNRVVPITNGIATVQAEDVAVALKVNNWTIMQGEPWPALQGRHLSRLPSYILYPPYTNSGGTSIGTALQLPGGIESLAITGPVAAANSINLGSSTLASQGTGTGVPNVPGSGYVNGTYSAVPLTGGSGSGALATISVSGGAVTSVNVTNGGLRYALGDQLSAAASSLGGSGSGFSITVTLLSRADAYVPNQFIAWARAAGWSDNPILSEYE